MCCKGYRNARGLQEDSGEDKVAAPCSARACAPRLLCPGKVGAAPPPTAAVSGAPKTTGTCALLGWPETATPGQRNRNGFLAVSCPARVPGWRNLGNHLARVICDISFPGFQPLPHPGAPRKAGRDLNAIDPVSQKRGPRRVSPAGIWLFPDSRTSFVTDVLGLLPGSPAE